MLSFWWQIDAGGKAKVSQRKELISGVYSQQGGLHSFQQLAEEGVGNQEGLPLFLLKSTHHLSGNTVDFTVDPEDHRYGHNSASNPAAIFCLDFYNNLLTHLPISTLVHLPSILAQQPVFLLKLNQTVVFLCWSPTGSPRVKPQFSLQSAGPSMTCLWKGLGKILPHGLSASQLRSEGGIWQTPADIALLPVTITRYFADRQQKINDSGRGAEASWKFKWCVWVKSDMWVNYVVLLFLKLTQSLSTGLWYQWTIWYFLTNWLLWAHTGIRD